MKGMVKAASIVGSWLLLLALVAQFAVPLLRYGFGASQAWLDDLPLYFFALATGLSVGWTLLVGRHAQVDVLADRWSPRASLRRDRIGFFMFLLPFAAALLWLSLPYAAASWRLLEASGSSGGMPGLFIVKTVLPVAALLLLIAGAQMAARRSG